MNRLLQRKATTELIAAKSLTFGDVFTSTSANSLISQKQERRSHMPDLFEQLKQKYQPVLDVIQKEGAELQNLNLDGNQLYLKATAVSEASKNRIWNAIKAVDANYADLKHNIEFRQGDQTARYRHLGQRNRTHHFVQRPAWCSASLQHEPNSCS
jgi:hypothetical protein